MLRHCLATLASAFALATLALPACADDAEVIETCVTTAYSSGGDAHVCIGRVADPCLQKPENQSTHDMMACSDKETKIWDAMLNSEYQTPTAPSPTSFSMVAPCPSRSAPTACWRTRPIA